MNASPPLILANLSAASTQVSRRLEDWVLTLVLTAMCLVPVAELTLRATLHTGIFGAASITQHLGLAVGMLGAAVATRERRLLMISALTLLIPQSCPRAGKRLRRRVGGCRVRAAGCRWDRICSCGTLFGRDDCVRPTDMVR